MDPVNITLTVAAFGVKHVGTRNKVKFTKKRAFKLDDQAREPVARFFFITLTYSPPTQEDDIHLPRFRPKVEPTLLGSVSVMAPTIVSVTVWDRRPPWSSSSASEVMTVIPGNEADKVKILPFEEK